jgi:hypothetical protein
LVVLHRAGAKGVKPAVDAVGPAGQGRVVAADVVFRQRGQGRGIPRPSSWGRALYRTSQRGEGRRLCPRLLFQKQLHFAHTSLMISRFYQARRGRQAPSRTREGRPRTGSPPRIPAFASASSARSAGTGRPVANHGRIRPS